MKSAGQAPNPLGSATVPNPLASAPLPQQPAAPQPAAAAAPQQPAAPAAATTAPVLGPADWVGSCMYDRGNDDGMKSYSVAGLNSYALLTAVMMGAGSDEAAKEAIAELPRWHVLYEPTADVMNVKGSVRHSAFAPRVTFDRVCHEDTSWTAPDGAYQFHMGSLGNRGPIEMDSAAWNRVTDLFDVEHEEQAQLFSAVKAMGLENWSNRMVHYFGAFGDSIVGPTKVVTAPHWYGDDVEVHQGMAFAFRKPGMEAYMAAVKQNLAAANQSRDGVLNLISAFAPINADEQMVIGALKVMGAEPGQKEFSLVLASGIFFNQADAKYNELLKLLAPRLAAEERTYEAAKYAPKVLRVRMHLDYLLASKEKADEADKQKANDLIRAIRTQLEAMSIAQFMIDEMGMTRDQREFLYTMGDEAKRMLDSLPQPITIVPKKAPPKKNTPPPPKETGGGVRLPEDF